MTVTDRADAPAPSPYEQEQIERFGIFAEERVVEEVARAIGSEAVAVTLVTDDEWDFYLRPDEQADYRRLAAAAVAAYRATQDGGAEEAVRRVEALCVAAADRCPPDDWGSGGVEDAIQADFARAVLAALAPQAGDGAR